MSNEIIYGSLVVKSPIFAHWDGQSGETGKWEEGKCKVVPGEYRFEEGEIEDGKLYAIFYDIAPGDNVSVKLTKKVEAVTRA